MAGCMMASNLKKFALGVVIALVVWSAAFAQQASSSQQIQPSEAEATVGVPPKIDQLKALRAQVEAAKERILSSVDCSHKSFSAKILNYD